MRHSPPITKLNWDEQSLSTLSTLTDAGALRRAAASTRENNINNSNKFSFFAPKSFLPLDMVRQLSNPTSSSERRGQHSASPATTSRSRSQLDDMEPETPRTPPEVETSLKAARPSFARRSLFRRKDGFSSPKRTVRSTLDAPQPPKEERSPEKSNKRTVVTLKRKKTRSELHPASPRLIPIDEIKHHRSFNEQQQQQQQQQQHQPRQNPYSDEKAHYDPYEEGPPIFKSRSGKYRTDFSEDRFFAGTTPLYDVEEPIYTPPRVDHFNFTTRAARSSPARGPVVELEESSLSDASSSIFADLDPEEESTIWGDLDDSGDKDGRQQKHRWRRRGRATRPFTMDASPINVYDEIRLPSRKHSSLRHQDFPTTGGQMSSPGKDKHSDNDTFMGAETFMGDPISMCMFMQDIVIRDCQTFLRC